MVEWLQRALATSDETLRRHPYYIEHPDLRPALDAAFAALEIALSPEWASDALPEAVRHPAAIRLTGVFRNQFWDVVELGIAIDIARQGHRTKQLVAKLRDSNDYGSTVFELLVGAWLTLVGQQIEHERPEGGMAKAADFSVMHGDNPRLLVVNRPGFFGDPLA